MKFEPTIKTAYEPTPFPYFLPQYAKFNEPDRQERGTDTRGGLSTDVQNNEGTPSKREDPPRDPRCGR